MRLIKSTTLQTIFLVLLWLSGACQEKSKVSKIEATDTVILGDNCSESLTIHLRKLQKLGHINGFSVAIVNHDKTLYQTGVGYADLADKRAYTKNTIQNIGSVSKTLIGIALLKAQEQGKLKLDDPVNKHLPFPVVNPYYPNLPITIRHLATHTSTITDTDYYDAKAYILKEEIDLDMRNKGNVAEMFNNPEEKISMHNFLEKLLSKNGEWFHKKNFLERKPGSLFEYSNVGATLAAYVIEQSTGEPFNKYTTKHILKPLGMSSSGWSFDDIDLSKHSILYENPGQSIPKYSLITYPDGGLITNIKDLGKYLTELIKGQSGAGTLLTKESYYQIFSGQLSTGHLPNRDKDDDYDVEYNSGIFMGFTPSGQIGHTGGDPGIATFMFFNPQTKIGRVLMINTSITSQEGVDQFYSIWNTLGKYEGRFN